MRKKPKPVPRFKSEADERRFWETHDSSAYVDWRKAERARFPALAADAAGRATRIDKSSFRKLL